ncbi:mucin-5AC-like [Planococcus citri]|uniref:mucin-5AC-like n=1 Tax=Planococcus citri TaxID=170843 RepID=UPI0031F86D2F
MADKLTIEQLRKLQNLVLTTFDNQRKWLENPKTQKTARDLQRRIQYLRQQYHYLMQKIETSEVQIKVEGTFQCIITQAESVLRQLESNTRSVPTQILVKRSNSSVSTHIVSSVPSLTADQSPAPSPTASLSLAASLPADPSPAPQPAALSISAAPLVSSSPPNQPKRFDKSLPSNVSPVTATPAVQNSASASVTTSESPHESCVIISDASVSSFTPIESNSSSTVSQAVTHASPSESQPESHPSCVMSCIPRTSGHQSSAEISNDSSTATLASAAVTDTHSALPMQRSIVNTASVNASSNVTAHSDESTPHPPSMAAYNAFTAPLRAPAITARSVVVPTCTSTVSSICNSLPTLESASAALPETSVSAAATATLSVPPTAISSANDTAHDASLIVISCSNNPPTSTTASASNTTISRFSSAFSTLSFSPVSTQAMSASLAASKAHHTSRSIVSATPTHSYAQVVASNTSPVPVSACNAPITARNAPATANCAPVSMLRTPVPVPKIAARGAQPDTALAAPVLTLPAPVPVASVTSHPTLPVLESAFVSDVPNITSTSPLAPVPALTSVLAVPQEPLAPAATIVTIFARRTPVSSANTAPVDHVSNVIVSSNELAPHSPTPATAVAFPAPSRTCISSASCSAVSTFATTASSTVSAPVAAPTASASAAASRVHLAPNSIVSTSSECSHTLQTQIASAKSSFESVAVSTLHSAIQMVESSTPAHSASRIHAPTRSKFASYPAASCSALSPPSYALPAPVIVSASVNSLSASVFAQEVALSAPVSVRPGPVTAAPASAFVLQQAAPFSAQVSVNASFVASVPVSPAFVAAQLAPASTSAYVTALTTPASVIIAPECAPMSATSKFIASSNQITSYLFAAAAAVASAAPPNLPFILHLSKQSQLHCTTFSALQAASIISNSAPESTASNDHAFGRQTTINTPSVAAALNATPSQHVSVHQTVSMLPLKQCRSTLPFSAESSVSAFLAVFILLLTALSAGPALVSSSDQASESLTIPSHHFNTVAESSDSATSTTLNQLVAPIFIAYLPSTVRASILNSATEGLNSQFWATEDPHIDFYAHYANQADIVTFSMYPLALNHYSIVTRS